MSDLDTITRLEKELAEKEEERRQTQCKLTDICSDVWDAADDYGVEDKSRTEFFVAERATLRRILIKLKSGE